MPGGWGLSSSPWADASASQVKWIFPVAHSTQNQSSSSFSPLWGSGRLGPAMCRPMADATLESERRLNASVQWSLGGTERTVRWLRSWSCWARKHSPCSGEMALSLPSGAKGASVAHSCSHFFLLRTSRTSGIIIRGNRNHTHTLMHTCTYAHAHTCVHTHTCTQHMHIHTHRKVRDAVSREAWASLLHLRSNLPEKETDSSTPGVASAVKGQRSHCLAVRWCLSGCSTLPSC